MPGVERRGRFGRFRDARTAGQRFIDGLELQALWREFKSEARVGYGFYAKAVDPRAIEHERRWRRPVVVGWLVIRAVLAQLSPTRRCLLVGALACLAISPVGAVGFPFPVTARLGLATLLLLALLALELADRVTMKRDLEIAREIQSWLVPETPPSLPGLELAFTSRPANTVGGDYVDALIRPSGDGAPETLLLTVADVAGKSVPAALLMATLQASFRTLAEASTSLPALVRIMNRAAVRRGGEGRRFVTAFFAELDPDRQDLAFICAGHNAPILRRAGGDIERLEAGSMPLGVDDDETFAVRTTSFQPGDSLLVYTDGVTDAVNLAGEMLGEPRLLGWIDEVANGATPLIDDLLLRIDAFVGDAAQRDDLTMLVLARS